MLIITGVASTAMRPDPEPKLTRQRDTEATEHHNRERVDVDEATTLKMIGGLVT
jgi:hypothetical protein